MFSTKITPPRLSRIVERSRLFRSLGEGLRGRLTTVTGLPGSGKTALLASWIHSGIQLPGPLAWLTLDQEDNVQSRLCAHLVAALQRAGASGRSGFDALVELPHQADFACAVADALGTLNTPTVLVLDDFHELRPGSARNAILQLIRHAPDGLRIVLASHQQPDLPLHKMQAAGQLTILRSQDLAFTDTESRELYSTAGVGLTADQLKKVQYDSGGWAMALRLAATTQRPDDSWTCLGGWSPVTRTCADFLLRELVEPLRNEEQDILLRISVLNSITAPLVRSVTGRSDASQLLRYLSTKYDVLTRADEWTYQMNPLIRQVLARELTERYGAAEVTALEEAAAEQPKLHEPCHEASGSLHLPSDFESEPDRKGAEQKDEGFPPPERLSLPPQGAHETQRRRVGESGPGLTKSELEVLRLLPYDVTLEEIAEQRYVSVNTVKTQVASIYRKLGVSRRRRAVETARSHDII